jgi:hypothetical protein
MKLSEAIILGSTLKPQNIGGWYNGKDGTCALGAALDAVGKLKSKGGWSDKVKKIWPWLKWPVTNFNCKACGRKHIHVDDMEDVVIHMNDNHERTRESIASWVAEIENGLEVKLKLSGPIEGKELDHLESHLPAKKTRAKKTSKAKETELNTVQPTAV